MKRMNLPNKLTLLRIALVPFIVAAMLIEFPLHYLVAGLLFGAASLTDLFDGKIARRDNLITDFGKFADPLADKILVISVLVCFLKVGLCGAVPLILILFREFSVTSIRLVAAAKGNVIAANMWGKVKTVCQIVAIIAIYVMQTVMDILSMILTGHTVPAALYTTFYQYANWSVYDELHSVYAVFNIIGQSLIWITAIITIISGVKYLIDNKKVIAEI